MNEWMNERMNEGMNEWKNEWLIEWMRSQLTTSQVFEGDAHYDWEHEE